MRKILLATTILAGFAVTGAAQAATSPLNVTVGGSVDFVAGAYHESAKAFAPTADLNDHDFETNYDLNFGITGKANNGLEYGGNLSLNNNPDIANNFAGNSYNLELTTADLFLAGAFGKVQLGDARGATDLTITTPVVGEGQVLGRYADFLDTQTFAKNFVYGIDGTDHSTNLTYYTPKVGNDMNKVQLGVTYTPNFYNYGTYNTAVNNSATANAANFGNALSPYRDVVKGVAAYTGNFNPVTLGVSGNVITGSADTLSNGQTWIANAPGGAKVRDFTAYGIGAQAGAEGFTLGGSYTDLGHYDSVGTQNNEQHQYTAGLKYEFSKVAVGVSYLGGEGYDNMLLAPAGGAGAGSNFNYVHQFNAYGAGGTYSWAPGLTTNLDGVLFNQEVDSAKENDGYVLLVSQKLAF